MQRRRFCVAALGVGAAAWLPARGRAGGDLALFDGIFALSGKEPKARAKLFVRYHSATNVTLLFTLSGLDGKRLSHFDVAMTKRMHVIIISDDFQTFQHLHAEPNADGLFSVAATLSPQGGGCQIYADTVPHGLGQHVFRFPVAFGAATPATPELMPTARTVPAGPYAVTIGSLTLSARSATMLPVRIAKHGAPATDLRPYLGGAAHAVFINSRTLAYTHVHPEAEGGPMEAGSSMAMDMGDPAELPAGARVDPAMTLHVVAPGPGRYKLWLQFRGGDALYVAPFVLTAS